MMKYFSATRRQEPLQREEANCTVSAHNSPLKLKELLVEELLVEELLVK